MTRHDRRAALAALMAPWMGAFHPSVAAAPRAGRTPPPV